MSTYPFSMKIKQIFHTSNVAFTPVRYSSILLSALKKGGLDEARATCGEPFIRNKLEYQEYSTLQMKEM